MRVVDSIEVLGLVDIVCTNLTDYLINSANVEKVVDHLTVRGHLSFLT